MDSTKESNIPPPFQTSSDHSSHSVSSAHIERPSRRTMHLEPKPTQRRKTRAISPDAVERRRKQNRASQIAFRERSKRKMEDLERELTIAGNYNQQLYRTMRGLLESTESLKATIEKALSSLPPPEYSRQNSEGYGWTPSDSEGPSAEPVSSDV